MKIRAIDILVAQALEQQEQEDVSGGPLPERRERRELGEQRPESRLESEFTRAGNPERLRIIDTNGDLSDVFISTFFEDGTFYVGVRPLQLKLVYPPTYERYGNFKDAESSLPEGWLVYEVFGSGQGFQAGDKELMAFASGNTVHMLRVVDEGPEN